MSTSPQLRILFLAASPNELGRVDAHEEARQIRERLAASTRRDAIDLVTIFDARPGDLQDLFFQHEPQIVHFSGHGSADEEIMLQDARGRAAPVDKRDLAALFRVHEDVVRVVVLNACHSHAQAEAISEHIDCAVGMRRAIGSQAAVTFAAAFYRAIAHGVSVQRAFDSAVAELGVQRFAEDRTPRLVMRREVDASKVFLVHRGTGCYFPPPPDSTAPPRSDAHPPSSFSRGTSAAPASERPPGPLTSTGQNRICTVISVDLSAVAAPETSLDPSRAKEPLKRCGNAAAKVIKEHGGETISRGLERLLGVFGLPSANEGDVEHAIEASLDIHSEFSKLRLPDAPCGSRPSCRIGISTGVVFAMAAGPDRASFDVSGDPVLRAGSLHQAASPGSVVLDRETARQVAGRFNVEPLLAVMSHKEPLPAYRLLGPLALQHGLNRRDFHGLKPAFIGRGPERARFIEALDELVKSRRARCFTLIGARGTGKTCMLAEIVAYLSSRRQTYILFTARGSSLAMEARFGLIVALLRTRFEIPEGASGEEIRQRLRGGVRWMLGRAENIARRSELSRGADAWLERRVERPSSEEIDAALEELAALLEQYSAVRLSPGLEGSAVKGRIIAAMVTLVRLAASIAPLTLLCDNLQWADGESLDLLNELLSQVRDLPLLAACAARPSLYERRPHWGGDPAAHQRVDLLPLERWHIEAMIRDRLRRVQPVPPELVRAVADRAGGNPYIMDETLRHLVSAGAIEAPLKRVPWRVRGDDFSALPLPAVLQSMVQERLDRLDPNARALLDCAAVVGNPFWQGAVDRLLRISSAAGPGPDTAKILSALRDRGLVRARETSTLPDEREYVFTEPVTQEAAYRTLPDDLRRSMHLAAAAWLRERAQGSARAATLAHHDERGGDMKAAILSLEDAADHASSLGQNAEARGHLVRACKLLDKLRERSFDPDEPPPDIPWDTPVRLRLKLGDVERRLGSLDQAEKAYQEGQKAISPTTPDRRRWTVRIELRMALLSATRGHTLEARARVMEALESVQEGGPRDELPAIYALLAALYRRERKLDMSRRAALDSLRACRAIGRDDERYGESMSRALLGLGPMLFSKKRVMGAERAYRKAARLAGKLKERELLGRALNGIAVSLLARGEYVRAWEAFRDAVRVNREAGDLHEIAVGEMGLAELANATGDHAAALEYARRSIRLAEPAQIHVDLASMYRAMALAFLGLERVAEAMDACARALQIAETSTPIDLSDILETLTEACERAASIAAPGSALEAKAAEARERVRAMRHRSFVGVDLRQRIERLGLLLAEPLH